jgi:hypothetical protein
MADENNAEDGELIQRGEAPPPAPARTAKHRTVDWLLSRLSRWPFSNRLYVKSLKTAQEVIQERTKLEEAIIGHGRTRGRLNDLGLTLEQEHLQRRREFLEEQNRLSTTLNESILEGEMMDQKNKLKKGEVKMQQEEQEIQRMDQQKRKLKVKRELEDLQKPPPEPAAQPNKRKLREDAYKHFDKEVKRVDAMKKATAERKTDLKNAARSDLEKELERIDRMP